MRFLKSLPHSPVLHSLTRSLTHSHTHTHTLSLSLSHTHTHRYTRTHTTRWKGIPKARQGEVYRSLFSIVDWFPTLVDVAGLGSVDEQIGTGSDIDREASGVCTRIQCSHRVQNFESS